MQHWLDGGVRWNCSCPDQIYWQGIWGPELDLIAVGWHACGSAAHHQRVPSAWQPCFSTDWTEGELRAHQAKCSGWYLSKAAWGLTTSHLLLQFDCSLSATRIHGLGTWSIWMSVGSQERVHWGYLKGDMTAEAVLAEASSDPFHHHCAQLFLLRSFKAASHICNESLTWRALDNHECKISSSRTTADWGQAASQMTPSLCNALCEKI